MAWTQGQLTALRAAIASGELSVQYEDKRVTYRSLNEMLRIQDLMVAELEGGRTTIVRSSFNKGLEQ